MKCVRVRKRVFTMQITRSEWYTCAYSQYVGIGGFYSRDIPNIGLDRTCKCRQPMGCVCMCVFVSINRKVAVQPLRYATFSGAHRFTAGNRLDCCTVQTYYTVFYSEYPHIRYQ